MNRKLPNIAIETLVAGCPKTFVVVFEFYYPIIVRYIHSKCPIEEDVEELIQETFVQLHLSKHKLQKTADIYPLLFTIAKRLSISYFRKQTSVRNTHLQAEKNWIYESNSTEESISYAELNRVLDQIISSLPPQQRQVYLLSTHENLSNENISIEMNLSRNTVKNHLRLANNNIRLSLSKIYNAFFL